MHYSDTNYVLLGVIAERVTGSSLPDLLARWIFGPLGLDDTYLEFHQPPRGNARLVYPYLGRMWLGDVNTSFDWGGGGLVSTHVDLHRFVRRVLEGRLFYRASTLAAMLDVRPEDDPRFLLGSLSSAYGLGVRRLTLGGRTWFGHSGSWGCVVLYCPEDAVSVSVAVHQGENGGVLARVLARILLRPIR